MLLLTADIGEGHNAAARALGDTAAGLWPGVELRTVDAIGVMGPGMSRLAQSSYRFVLARVPRVYQLFYDLLWRHRSFAWVAKRFIAAWCGRRVRGTIRRWHPDLVVCTHPFGAAAMDWLRRSGGPTAPAVLFITDFAPHPFWVYPQLDLHLVLHPLAAALARRFGAERVRTAALPVAGRFHPRDRRAARRALGLREDAFVALVTGGAWGIGTLEPAVAALLRGIPQAQVVAVCGRNQALRERLAALGAPTERLVVLGFVDTMPELLGACDVVVTNAGGATSLEAFASSRPVVLFDPIVGHGRANAALMEHAGLAVVCHGAAALRVTLAELAAGGVRVARLRAAARQVAERDLAGDVRLLAALAPPARRRGQRLRLAVRLAAATVLAMLLVTQGSYVAGTRLAPAARGAPAPSGVVAIALAGSLRPEVLLPVARAARAAGVPLTFFVEGADATADPASLDTLAGQGFEVEAGTWQAGRDDQLHPGRVHAEFSRTLEALTRAGCRPRYVAEPGGQFSLVAVATTRRLHLRRVVFGRRAPVPGRAASPSPPAPGQIVELLVLPNATAAQVGAAVEAVAAAARGRGLRLATVSEMDPPDVAAPAAGSNAAPAAGSNAAPAAGSTALGEAA